MMTAGNLGTSQAVINILDEQIRTGDETTVSLYNNLAFSGRKSNWRDLKEVISKITKEDVADYHSMQQ